MFQHMNDDHVYETENEDGSKISWRRIYTVPRVNMDTRVVDYSASEWRRHTDNKAGTVGDLMDASAEWSAERERKEGVDPIKEKTLDAYSKKRNGIEHPVRKQQKLKQEMDKLGFLVE